MKTIMPSLVLPVLLLARGGAPSAAPTQSAPPKPAPGKPAPATPAPAKAATPAPAPQATPPPGAIRVYVGTYTGGPSGSMGIYRLMLDAVTGAFNPEGEPAATVSPSFLAFSRDGKQLFAVNESGDAASDTPGGVSSFSVDPATGELTLLSRNSSAGAAPCHVSLDREGKHVLVANYWGGSVAVFAVQPDGRLGAVTSFVRHTGVNPTPRDPGPHPHSVHVDPSNRWALVTDLGLDKLFVYRYYGDKGAISPAHEVALDKGAGPRHLAFDQDGRGFFVLNELNGTVVSFAFDPNDGSVTRQHTMSTLQPGFRGANSSAEVVVSRDGRFLYASNRGPNDIAIFEILRPSRELRLVGHQSTLGQHPRNFAIDSTGKFLVVANRDSNNVVAFRIDSMTGQLTPVGKPISVPSPACIRMRWAAS